MTKKVVLFTSIILTLSALAVTFFVTRSNDQPSSSEVSSVETPNFKTFLPKDRTIEQLGGWKKLVPPNGEPVYVFTDTIDDVSITVSQQPLPDSFTEDPTKSLASLSEAYSATESFDANGTKVYIGKSSLGPQSVLLIKGDVLILIKSEKTISNDAWTAYVNSLV